MADAGEVAPQILLDASPATPVLPGQTLLIRAQAQSYGGPAAITLEVRGEALGRAEWTQVNLDEYGRAYLTPVQPGLIELRANAQDADGFESSASRQLRVRDPADQDAPALAWAGALQGREGVEQPLDLAGAIALHADLREAQLMQWRLELIADRDGATRLLAEQSFPASRQDGVLELTRIDPADFSNGLYTLRLTARDLAGRAGEIQARIGIDSVDKTRGQGRAVDFSVQLAGHEFQLVRVLDTSPGDFGNWCLPLLDTRLSHDQRHVAQASRLQAGQGPALPPFLEPQAAANQSDEPAGGAPTLQPWREGARVWLTAPDGGAALRFTLGVNQQPLAATPGAPVVWKPVFSSDQGWNLELGNTTLQRLGQRLYQLDGRPWQPEGYTLTAPDGARYDLDAEGRVQQVRFSDGASWRVSDAGIVGSGDPNDRIDFLRDPQGRIVAIEAPGAEATRVFAYQYDNHRLSLVRPLDGSHPGQPYAYTEAGQLDPRPIAVHLGGALQWSATPWQGELQPGQSTTLSFTLRDGELASTAKGGVILALTTQGVDSLELLSGQHISGQHLGTAVQGDITTHLIRLDQAGLQRIHLTGAGAAQLTLRVAGDLNQDGQVDARDLQAFAVAQASLPARTSDFFTAADLDGDGQLTAADLQLLQANLGWRANQAPQAAVVLPEFTTHVDLAREISLDPLALDPEGDPIYWRLLDATHGSARLIGSTLHYTPTPGYAGEATLRLQADDGYTASAPIEIQVQVSDAKLLHIHLDELPPLQAGQSLRLQARVDFEDAAGVVIDDPAYLTLENLDLAAYGVQGGNPLQVDDAQDRLTARNAGPALLRVSRADAGGVIQTHLALNLAAAPDADTEVTDAEETDYEPAPLQLDLHPTGLTLLPGGQRPLYLSQRDPDSGETQDLHAATRVVFPGSPASVLEFPDPETQTPLLDPETGEPLVDPETGELLLDPDSGSVIQIALPARPEILSSTRYFISDPRVAAVDADGRVRALGVGSATLSVVYLDSRVDEYGQLLEQTLHQIDLPLTIAAAQTTDLDPATPAPETRLIRADHGGAVAAATGETILIAPGALAADHEIRFQRSEPAIALPDRFTRLGVFHLELGETPLTCPVQLLLPQAAPGTEILLLRQGQVATPEGDVSIWWLADQGVLTADVRLEGDRRLPGIDRSGDYAVLQRPAANALDHHELRIGPGEWLHLADLGIALAGGAEGVELDGAAIDALLSQSRAITAGAYHYGVPQFAYLPPVAQASLPARSSDFLTPLRLLADSALPEGQTHRLDTSQHLPPIPSPWGQIALPNLTHAEISNDGGVRFQFDPGASDNLPYQLVLRAHFANGAHLDFATLATPRSEIHLTRSHLQTPANQSLALASVTWQLVRQLDLAQLDAAGDKTATPPLEFAGNTLKLEPIPHMAAALTRTGIDFFRQNQLAGQALIEDMPGSFAELEDYLTGRKAQPIAYSGDLSRVYVAGKGKVYVFDSLSFEQIGAIKIPNGMNLSSLVIHGNLLLLAEGRSHGQGASGARLLAMNLNPGAATYHQPIVLQNTGLEHTPLGVAGMALGPDGRTLVVAAPKLADSVVSAGAGSARGDILIFDLARLNLETGSLGAPIKANLPADGRSGKAPERISATSDPNRFLVTHVMDYDRGLATLKIERGDQGEIVQAKLTAIDLAQAGDDVLRDRLDLQRAQSAVLVEVDGIEYALVADDHYNFNDPYWREMYAAPNFIYYDPNLPPMAVGGSADAKKVNVGGKLGIVQDPFGQARYLGATTPLPGYRIQNLALSQDGKTLIGQLKGDYLTVEQSVAFPSRNLAWNTGALIQAALKHDQGLRQGISLPGGVQQEIPWPDGDFHTPAGTGFDPEPIELRLWGNLGDVIEVDLRWHLADALARQRLGLGPSHFQYTHELAPEEHQGLVALRENILKFEMDRSRFQIDAADIRTYADDFADGRAGLILVTQKGQTDHDPYSRKTRGSTVEAEFKDTGLLYLAPNLTKEDVAKLRAGDRVAEKQGQLWLTFSLQDDNGSWKTSRASLTLYARDYAATGREVFFGDRPLNNPGYSAFTLQGAVGMGLANDVLDVFRVEQRLKYLGFPAAGTGNPSLTNNTIQDFKIDGVFAAKERAALKLFEKVVRYQNTGVNSRFDNNQNDANGVLGANETISLNWLNAYNAPHWMQLFGSTGNSTGPKFRSVNSDLPGWKNSQIGSSDTNVEVYGTSWLFDLMAAKHCASGLAQSNSRFNGAVDANYGFTPKWNPQGANGQTISGQHSTHDLGMAFDLGVSQYIGSVSQDRELEPLTLGKHQLQHRYYADGSTYYSWIPDKAAYEAGRWSYANAVYLSGLLPNTQGSSTQRNQQLNALRDFLSLYTVIRSDTIQNNGSWEELPVRNGAAVRTALFGSGQAIGALISKVHIGGSVNESNNPYRNINNILGRLGVASSPVEPHKHHFHIYLQPPEPIGIAQYVRSEFAAPGLVDQTPSITAQEQMLSEIGDEFMSLLLGEEIMFGMDVPYVPEHDTPMVIAQANTGNNSTHVDYILKACAETEHTPNDPKSALRGIDPAGYLVDYLEGKFKKLLDLSAFKPSLVHGVKHGKITTEIDNEGNAFYRYDPNPGYLGKDQATFMVQYAGKNYKVIVDVKVLEAIEENRPVCPAPKMIKAIKPTKGDAGGDASYTLAGLTFNFTNLPHAALAQTTAQTLTFDLDAAGHGWYFDPTPDANEEFLPTSNPNEWQARPGSEAAGRMDFYSVLWHEIGHSVGLGHSLDGHDYMAASLAPGVRRLPSAAEQMEMAGLAGGGGAQAASDPIPTPALPLSQGISSLRDIKGREEEPIPTPALPLKGREEDAPLPGIPVGTGLAALLVGRLRGSAYGTWIPEPAGQIHATATQAQYDTATQPTLADFTTPAAWTPNGDVTFHDGQATLAESPATHSRLNQLFTLGANDRSLSFSLSNLQLGHAEGGPGDAFEVALIDPNTNLSLLGSAGLTHSDAFLNRQADGTEHRAPQVTRFDHPDGRQTYTVDLSALAAGSTVSLRACENIQNGRNSGRHSRPRLPHSRAGCGGNPVCASD